MIDQEMVEFNDAFGIAFQVPKSVIQEMQILHGVDAVKEIAAAIKRERERLGLEEA